MYQLFLFLHTYGVFYFNLNMLSILCFDHDWSSTYNPMDLSIPSSALSKSPCLLPSYDDPYASNTKTLNKI